MRGNFEMNRAPLFNDTPEKAKKYSSSTFQNTYYLGFRDIKAFLKKYPPDGNKAIDYGCGTGRSTTFLKSLGFEPIGVDISKNMLKQAIAIDKESHYFLIESSKIPVLEETYDLFFSSFVFFTISSQKSIFEICCEAHRVLNNRGIFLVVTGSEQLYSHDWLSYDVDFPQNKNLTHGGEAKIFLKDLGIEYINYFWPDEILCDLFIKAGFRILKKHFPLGRLDENPNWISEIKVAPYVIYILEKIVA
ncbi:MAG: class I SAM-dependent methyltransferase [Chlamydiae bacterium]|nr:class I SAM-dependent methyltransferase [Chlamydiota bacterium]